MTTVWICRLSDLPQAKYT